MMHMAVQVITMGMVVPVPMVCVIMVVVMGMVVVPVGAVIMWHWTISFPRTRRAGSSRVCR